MLKKLAMCCLLLSVILVLTACSTTSSFRDRFGDKVSFFGTQDGNTYVDAWDTEGYEDLLSKSDVHDTFIPYEKVKMLGDLKIISAVVNLKRMGNTVTQIELDSNGGCYIFEGEQGTVFYINNPAKEIKAEEYPVVTDIPNKHDLRNYSPGKQCTYRVGDIIYYYYNELETITWRSKYHVYTIMLEYGVQYDNEFLLKLFDEDTAEETVNEFNESIEQMIRQRKLRRNLYPIITAMVIIVVPILSYLLICRKKEKRAAQELAATEPRRKTAEPPQD